ncbi:MAG: hypothetical protein KIH04_00825 [Candidatus Freyarchaeota archaeon]|nr:hypothetical protein [Candidatus Jordarchaeia archaeon]
MQSFSKILLNKQYARIGDGVSNLIYSLALFTATGEVKKTKLPGSILATALKASGLRSRLPSRQDKYGLSDAAEALIGYAWLKGKIEIKDVAISIASLINSKVPLKDNFENLVLGFTLLLKKVVEELSKEVE